MGSSLSYIWRSIIWGREALNLGLRWRIGNGQKVNIFQDPWLPRPSAFKPITTPDSVNTNWQVSELLLTNPLCWDMLKINNIFWPVDRDLVTGIPLSFNVVEDTVMWHFDRNGIFTVKSCYKAIKNNAPAANCSSPGSLQSWWSFLWSLKIPNKIKVFIWRCYHDILPSLNNLGRRGINIQSYCRRCGEGIEPIWHALIACDVA